MHTFDYIVIGAGSAGCAVARGLSDDPERQVLLLEAGPGANKFWVRTPAGMAKLYFNEGLNWNYYTAPLPGLRGRRMYWPRGKALGGSSSINGMIFIRGHAQDFDSWRDLGNPGWGFDDVLPYFKQMEHNERGADAYRAVGGPLWVSDPVVRHQSSYDFIEAAARHGVPRTVDVNGASCNTQYATASAIRPIALSLSPSVAERILRSTPRRTPGNFFSRVREPSEWRSPSVESCVSSSLRAN